MRKKILNEKIITDGISKAGIVAYHRTGDGDNPRDPHLVKDVIYSIMKTGFRPGNGDMYGKGLYATTDRASSYDPGNVGTYGIGLLKLLIPAKGILFLDYNLAKYIYGDAPGDSGLPKYTLVEQLLHNGVYKIHKQIPDILQILSEDLENTWGASGRKNSADRAYNIFTDCCIKGKQPGSVLGGMHNVDKEIKASYRACKNTLKRFDKNPMVSGIVFSGNHDGNVVVCYKLTKIKLLAWGCGDPDFPLDPKKWAYPMTPAKGNASIVDPGMVIPDLADSYGNIPRGCRLDSLYISGCTADQAETYAKDLKKYSPTLTSKLSMYDSLRAAIRNDGELIIYGGNWNKGTLSGYFGCNSDIMKSVEKVVGHAVTLDALPEFNAGVFDGKYFSGKFSGGVFRKGIFHGLFTGGIWEHSPDAMWGTGARFIENPNSSIRYEGKIYKLDTDPVEWVRRYEQKKAAGSTTKNFVDDTLTLQENIEKSLPYKAEVNIEHKWGGQVSLKDKFISFKKKYPWLWSKGIKFRTIPEIYVEDTDITLSNGILVLGSVQFDKYDQGVEVIGGSIEGNNTFKGSFRAGFYRQGVFEGVWYGGNYFADSCVWKSVEPLVTGKQIFDNPRVRTTTTIYIGSKRIEIVPLAYEKFPTMPLLLAGIRSGEYKDVEVAFKKKKANQTSRADQFKQKAGDEYLKRYGSKGISTQDIINLLGNDEDDEPDDDYLNMLGDSVIADTLTNKLFEKYGYDDLSPAEQDKLYAEFKDTYEKVTGAAFDRHAFDWRADNWTFFGEPPDESDLSKPCGGVAVRKQRSNKMYKMVASFGNIRGVMRGFIEMNSKIGNDPIWGIVTPDIKKMLLRANKSYVDFPGMVVKLMEPALKKLSNGEVKSVSVSGIMKVNTPAGITDKVFVANIAYVKWLINMVEDPAMADKIPVPQIVLKPALHLIKKLV